jgi:predicted small lipoprotein YifL
MLKRKFSVAAASMATLEVSAWMIAAALLVGCGQKGPLTLPQPASPASAARP